MKKNIFFSLFFLLLTFPLLGQIKEVKNLNKTYEFNLGHVIDYSGDTQKILPSLDEDSYFVTVHVDNNGDGYIDFIPPSGHRARLLVESSKFEYGQLMIFEFKDGKDPGIRMIFTVGSNKEKAFGLLIEDKLLKKTLSFVIKE